MTSEEVIPNTRPTQITRQTAVSEPPNQADILRNFAEAVASPHLDHYEVKYQENTIENEYDIENPLSNNDVRRQQANLRRSFIQNLTIQRYDPGTGSDTNWRNDMSASMDNVVSEYSFTQGDYNDIIVILTDIDPEVAIETVALSVKNNNDEAYPTLTKDMAVKELYQWIDNMNI